MKTVTIKKLKVYCKNTQVIINNMGIKMRYLKRLAINKPQI